MLKIVLSQLQFDGWYGDIHFDRNENGASLTTNMANKAAILKMLLSLFPKKMHWHKVFNQKTTSGV